ncbi:hypothetical protein DNTS_022645 [Danionella cerebrum]|uniref:SEFIR domain-containing protein n=1 Tax=Danionella cerebrum TaxID=2873325 RepID=A0A553R733_9TELE|nr:hypothetical protein DNTS_022645 [Danionella translucida]TRY98002.1 hypothetical protein DNTS_022645 [Danionella translucida]
MSVCARVLLLLFSVWQHTLEGIEHSVQYHHHQLICSQAITHCEFRSGDPFCLCEADEHVRMSNLDVAVVQCQNKKTLTQCLKFLINVTVTELDDGSTEEEIASEEGNYGSPHPDEEEEHVSALPNEGTKNKTSSAQVCVCYSFPSQSFSRVLSFTVSSEIQVRLRFIVQIPRTHFGSPVFVYSPNINHTQQLTVPSEDEFCSWGFNASFCRVAPKLRLRPAPEIGGFILFVGDADHWVTEQFSVCRRYDSNGGCLGIQWTNTSHEYVVLLHSIAPCLCFEIWGRFPRTEFCPFRNETGILSSIVEISLSEAPSSLPPPSSSSSPLLWWTIKSLCRLEAQLWLCEKHSTDKECTKVKKRVQIRQNHSWAYIRDKHWELMGGFDQQRHSSLCIQVKVAGHDAALGPVCPFEGERKHWSFLLLGCFVLVCASVLGAYAVQGQLKGLVFRWKTLEGIKPLPLLILSPPDPDSVFCSLIGRFASSLTALGFFVTLDLFSGSEIAILGPVPWLFSAVDRIKKHQGRVLLILNPSAIDRVEHWSPGQNREIVSPSSEVFDAILNRIHADVLLGRTVLVHFESKSPVFPLPEIFRGLPQFCLCRQSLEFLFELMNGVSSLHVTALRNASQTLSDSLNVEKVHTV